MSENQIMKLQGKIEKLQQELAQLSTRRGLGEKVRHIQLIAAEIDYECQEMYFSHIHIPIAQRSIYRSPNPYV